MVLMGDFNQLTIKEPLLQSKLVHDAHNLCGASHSTKYATDLGLIAVDK